MAVWSSGWPFGAPGGRFELQVVVWSSRWPFGAPGGRLELRVSMGEFGDVDKCWHQDMGESMVRMGEMR